MSYDVLGGAGAGASIGATVGGPVGALAGGLIGGIAGFFGGKKQGESEEAYRQRRRAAIAEYRAANPEANLLPADYRAAEQTRGRLTEAANASGELAGYDVMRRARARGLAASPSAERDLARVAQQTAAGREGAANSAEEQLYNVGQANKSYGQQRERDIFGAQVGSIYNDQARSDAEQAAFWNSVNEFIPSITAGLGPRTGGGAAAAAPGGTTRSIGFSPTGGGPQAGQIGRSPGMSPPRPTVF